MSTLVRVVDHTFGAVLVIFIASAAFFFEWIENDRTIHKMSDSFDTYGRECVFCGNAFYTSSSRSGA